MVFHVIVAISSFALLIFLTTMEARMSRHNTPNYGVTILMALLATTYGMVGVVTFWRSRYTWGRVLAIYTVLILLIYYFSVIGLHYVSAICGIGQLGNETLVVTFNETRIQDCDWDVTACLLSFPDNIMVRCSTMPSFWKHVMTVHGQRHCGLVTNKLVDGGLLYNIFFLIVLFLSLVLSMILGTREAVLVRPAAFRSSVPLTSIV